VRHHPAAKERLERRSGPERLVQPYLVQGLLKAHSSSRHRIPALTNGRPRETEPQVSLGGGLHLHGEGALLRMHSDGFEALKHAQVRRVGVNRASAACA
jgi:hypothetical protein